MTDTAESIDEQYYCKLLKYVFIVLMAYNHIDMKGSDSQTFMPFCGRMIRTDIDLSHVRDMYVIEIMLTDADCAASA